jgi:chromosome segregation ATPase
MPYLFGSKLGAGTPPISGGPRWENSPSPARSMGAPQNMDAEALKKYLALREQDVAALSAQLKTAKEQWGVLESQLKSEREGNQDLQRQIEELQARYAHLERERSGWADGEQKRAQELEFQLKMKVDKARILEQKVHETADEVERIKDRVRMDIRKIRVREKELENRLEILKKDSEALIAARENKIVELKRKLDLNEFNMDLLQDKYAKEKEQAARLKERLDRAQRAMRVADGFLVEEEGEPKTRAG